jgi:two-component system NtrC family sensor kinase
MNYGISVLDSGPIDLPSLGNLSEDDLRHFSRLIMMGQLSACFAHEVRNPLMLILGHLHFVQETMPTDHPLRGNFEVIERASHRIEEMSKKMLDFSKKRTRQVEPADLAEVMSDALRFVQPYMRSQMVDIQAQIEPDLPLVRLDRWQMAQAIVNVLLNAGEAMAGLDRRVLSITAAKQPGHLRLAISDTGPGITPTNLQKIFDPFFTTKGERGTGLGLYITKQVIEEHRGTINVQTGSRGTSFVISLPL